MFPFVSPLYGQGGQGDTSTSRVAYTLPAPYTTSMSLRALGAQPGDLLVCTSNTVIALANAPAGSRGLQWTALTAADLSSTATPSNNAYCFLAIYRNAASLALRVEAAPAPVSGVYTAAGFNKHPLHRGLLAMIALTRAHTVIAPDAPATFAVLGDVQDGNDGRGMSDRLYPVNAVYVDNTPFRWNVTPASTASYLYIFELRGAA